MLGATGISRKFPRSDRAALIPKAAVPVAPGKSMVMNVPLSSRKPWPISLASGSRHDLALQRYSGQPRYRGPGTSIVVKVNARAAGEWPGR